MNWGSAWNTVESEVAGSFSSSICYLNCAREKAGDRCAEVGSNLMVSRGSTLLSPLPGLQRGSAFVAELAADPDSGLGDPPGGRRGIRGRAEGRPLLRPPRRVPLAFHRQTGVTLFVSRIPPTSQGGNGFVLQKVLPPTSPITAVPPGSPPNPAAVLPKSVGRVSFPCSC